MNYLNCFIYIMALKNIFKKLYTKKFENAYSKSLSQRVF